MSAVNYAPFEPGDARDAASLNAIWNAIATASGQVAAVNFAEEGLDARALADHPVGARTGEIKETTRNAASLAVSAAYVQFVHNGVAYRLTSAAGDIPSSLAANEALRIRSRVWFETTLAAGLGFTGTLQTRLVYDGAPAVALDYSERVTTEIAGYTHTTVFNEGWMFGALNPIAWVELQYALSVGGVAFPSKGMIWATLFRRQNVV